MLLWLLMMIRNKLHEVGQNVMSGGRLSECAGEENPCRQAYIDYLGYGLARYIFQLRTFKNDDGDDDGDDGHYLHSKELLDPAGTP